MLLAAEFNSFSFSHVFIKRDCEHCNHYCITAVAQSYLWYVWPQMKNDKVCVDLELYL